MPSSDVEEKSPTAFVYVSNAVEGDISSYRLYHDGRLEAGQTAKAADMAMPMAVTPDGARLYLATRSEPFAILSFAIDRTSGALTKVASCPINDSFSFLSLDRDARYLLAASYVGSCVRVFAIDESRNVDPSPVESQFDIPQAHAIRVDNSNTFAYVPSLGADAVYQYRFDALSGRLHPLDPPRVCVPAKYGPRHFVFSADNQFIYVLNEMQASVTAFRRDAVTGLLDMQASVSGLPKDCGLVLGAEPSITPKPSSALSEEAEQNWIVSHANVRAADIHATPDNRFIFTSERASRTLASFQRDDATGKLTYRANVSVDDRPRSFAIDPSGRYLIVAAEVAATVGVYSIGTDDGTLTCLGTYPAGKGANWVEIVRAR